MPIKVFNFAGQSNMVGLRAFLDYIPSFGLDSDIGYVRNSTVGTLGPDLVPDPEDDDGFRGGGFVPPGQASLGYCVEIFLSHIFAATPRDVLALKSAETNTSLAAHWNSTTGGREWRQFVQNTNAGFDHAEARDADVSVGPLIWWQGETDASRLDYATAYESNLSHFIADYRDLVDDPRAPVVIVQTISGGAGLARVQAAQRDVATADPNVILYDPSHLARYSDGLHFTRDYAIEAAADIADLIVAAGWGRTEHLWGGAGADVLTGTAAAQRLWGLAGDDALRGLGGNDTLAGDLGADRLDGGSGADTAVYDAATAGVAVDLAAGTGRGDIAGGDRLIGIERLQGGLYADTLTGGQDANQLLGGPGTDQLLGGGDRDVLNGGADSDTLTGGGGGDRLTGGAGRDRFNFDLAGESTAGEPDVLYGFDGPAAAAGDIIGLARVDADLTRAGDQAFVLGGGGAGRLSLAGQGTDTILRGNIDGDAAFEFVLLIRDGASRTFSAYSAADFVM